MRNAECDTQKKTGDDQHVRDVERDLHVIVNPAYTNIWKARDVEEFKTAFLDCLECKRYYHYSITPLWLTFSPQVITTVTLPAWFSTAISAKTI